MEIKPIAQFEVIESTGFRREVCKIKPVRQLEADFKEVIETLEDVANYHIELNDFPSSIFFDTAKRVIEKAYGKSWEDIRRKK